MTYSTMQTIESLSDIPPFQTEADEAEFWSTHELSDVLLSQLQPIPDSELPPVRGRTRPIAVRLDADVLGRLRRLAALKGKGYQALLKEFITERLYEEERREGILPPRGS